MALVVAGRATGLTVVDHRNDQDQSLDKNKHHGSGKNQHHQLGKCDCNQDNEANQEQGKPPAVIEQVAAFFQDFLQVLL